MSEKRTEKHHRYNHGKAKRLRKLLRKREGVRLLWPSLRRIEAQAAIELNNERINDSRDKTNWGHGKMQRAGVFATRKRT